MADNAQRKKISAASARSHTRRSKKTSTSFRLSSSMIAQLVVGVAASFLVWAYLAAKPAPPNLCGSPGGPPVTSTRVKLNDGRYLAYKETGVSKEEAKYKIIVVHGFDNSKDFTLPLSQDRMKELQVYLLSFDRAGYGESDPNPARSVDSEAYEIQELADKLGIGQKFYIIGISLGSYPVWSLMRYMPDRLSGAALVVPHVNYWWPCFPAELSKGSLKKHLKQDQWTFRIPHYTPWLVNWWMTQNWFPSLSIFQGSTAAFSRQDLEIIKHLSSSPGFGQLFPEKVRQQGVYESVYRDMIVGFGKWKFDPLDIANPFPNKEGTVHLWQGYEDRLVPFELNRYISQKLPWIQYHEVPDAGHLLILNATLCEAIIRELISG